MPKPIRDTESLAELFYPTSGVDTSTEYSTQPPLTTPGGVNGRAFDPREDRSRGGSRPGLTRYINGLVGTANVVQHLNYVVDPQVQALPDYNPPGGGDDPGTTGGDNPGGGGPDGDGTYLDPTEEGRNASHRRVRYGGSGIQTTKKRKRKRLQFVQGSSSSGASPLATAYPASVQANSLLVVAALTANATASTQTHSLADTRGNVYSQVGSYVSQLGTDGTGRFAVLSLWYCITTAGANTVTVTESAGEALQVQVLEYKGVVTTSSLSGQSSNSGTIGASASLSAGSPGVDTENSLVLAVVGFYGFGFVGVGSWDVPRNARAGGASSCLFPADYIGTNVTVAMTGVTGAIVGSKAYTVIGAAFRPLP